MNPERNLIDCMFCDKLRMISSFPVANRSEKVEAFKMKFQTHEKDKWKLVPLQRTPTKHDTVLLRKNKFLLSVKLAYCFPLKFVMWYCKLNSLMTTDISAIPVTLLDVALSIALTEPKGKIDRKYQFTEWYKGKCIGQSSRNEMSSSEEETQTQKKQLTRFHHGRARDHHYTCSWVNKFVLQLLQETGLSDPLPLVIYSHCVWLYTYIWPLPLLHKLPFYDHSSKL